MNDPSYGVPPQVLPHIHLVSSHKFPDRAQLSPETALEHLLNGPRITRDAASVSWTYFQHPPRDSSVFLTWVAPVLLQARRAASDGYIWGDPESMYHVNIGDYTLEIFIHHFGYRPGMETHASHRRTRFRIASKNPMSQVPNPDPNLVLFHYTQCEPQNRFPADRIAILPDQHRTMTERQMIERQGLLLRKDFMLNDRANWPKVELGPGNQMQMGPGGQPRPVYPINPMQHQMAGMPRHAQFHGAPPPGQMGPSPAKRQRQAPAQQQMPPGMPQDPIQTLEMNIMDDEAIVGDYLDHLTPREISTVRYIQHHEWMEEVFASSYATNRILPIDLGLGLTGELAQLTNGLLDTPIPDNLPRIDNDFYVRNKDGIETKFESLLYGSFQDPPNVIPRAHRKLAPGQLEEFQKRVEKYEQDGKADLEKMKKEHAQKMADIRRSKTYVTAERRLRDAVWGTKDLFDQSKPADGPTEPEPINALSPSSKKQVENIINDIEKSLNVSVRLQKDVACVDKGGLIEEITPPQPPVAESNAANGEDENPDAQVDPADESLHFPDDSGLNGLLDDDENAMDAENTAAGLLAEYGSGSLVNTPGANLSAPGASQPSSMINSAAHTPAATSAAVTGGAAAPTSTSEAIQQGDPADASAAVHADADLDMDLDIDISNLPDLPGGDDDDTAANKAGEDNDWVMVDDNNNAISADKPIDRPSLDRNDSSVPPPDPSAAAAAVAEPTATTGRLPQDVPGTSAAQDSEGAAATASAASPGLFDASEFGAFDMPDDDHNTAGDALADLGGSGDNPAANPTPPAPSVEKKSDPGAGSGGGAGDADVLGEVDVEVGATSADVGGPDAQIGDDGGIMPNDDELGLDLDGSAFGDAFVGMEGDGDADGQ